MKLSRPLRLTLDVGLRDNLLLNLLRAVLRIEDRLDVVLNRRGIAEQHVATDEDKHQFMSLNTVRDEVVEAPRELGACHYDSPLMWVCGTIFC
jgi:hypothetical protein